MTAPRPESHPEQPAEGPLNVVTLRLGGELLAIPTRNLREVLEPVAITPVPNAPPFCTGLINVRGAVVPLADLRVPFGMAPAPGDEDTRILVLELPLDGQAAAVGILADSVQEVTEIDAAGVEALPAVGSRWPAQFVRGIARTGASPASSREGRRQDGRRSAAADRSHSPPATRPEARSGDTFVMLPDLDAIFAHYLDRPGGRASPDKGADR